MFAWLQADLHRNTLSGRDFLLFHEAEELAVVPKFLRFENADRRDDARDEFGRRYVESRVARVTARIGHAHIPPRAFRIGAPRPEHLRLVTLLDRNVRATFQIPIDG